MAAKFTKSLKDEFSDIMANIESSWKKGLLERNFIILFSSILLIFLFVLPIYFAYLSLVKLKTPKPLIKSWCSGVYIVGLPFQRQRKISRRAKQLQLSLFLLQGGTSS